MPFDLNLGYILIGLAVGLLVGLTGVGGGSLMTPVLTAVFGIPAATAVGTDLAFAAITKSAGTVMHRVHNNINWRIVRLMITGSIPGSVLTTAILHYLGVGDPHANGGLDTFIRWTIATCVILTVIALLLRPRIIDFIETRPKFQFQGKKRDFATLFAAFFIGVLVTLSSIGAGAIGAIVLVILYPHLRSSEIAGTDIAYAVPLTTVAAIGHFSLGTLDFALLGALLIGSIPGITLGSYLSRTVPERYLRGILATTLAVVAAKLVM